MLLCVHSYPGANHLIPYHLPYWQRAGFDPIIGIGTTGGGCQWPGGMQSVEIGRNTYIAGDALPRRLVDTAAYLLALPGWEHAAIIEYDTVIFKPLPVPPPGLAMVNCVGPQPGHRKGTYGYHNPWLANRATWARVVECGRQMLVEGDIEGGSPDCFIGWLAERFGIPIHGDLFKLYTQNTINQSGVEAAKFAYRSGWHAIHGLKNISILQQVIA